MRSVVLLVLAGCGAAAAASPQRVVVVSIDGLRPDTYLEPDALGLQVPTLRRLAREGTAATDALSVLPSVTYPAHTTIATGVAPGRHGVVTNNAFDPLERNLTGWRWYAEDILVPTLWQAALAAGRRTALIDWPVTVGAKADVLVPEYWRAGTADDQKLSRALSTPGLLEEVAARRPGFWQRYTPPDVTDEAGVDVAVHVIEKRRPALLFLHIWQTDDAQHRGGPGSDEAKQSIENADNQLARLVAAAGGDTVFVVVSDHGFARADRSFRPSIVLRERGLISVDAAGKISSCRAQAGVNGFTYIYLQDRDEATRGAVREAFRPYVGAGQPIEAVLEAEEIRARGGDPAAFLGLDPAPGWRFLPGHAGEVTQMEPGPIGIHGMNPERPDMRATLLFWGPGIAAGRRLTGARLVDVAPTVAAILGIAFPSAEGRALNVRR